MLDSLLCARRVATIRLQTPRERGRDTDASGHSRPGSRQSWDPFPHSFIPQLPDEAQLKRIFLLPTNNAEVFNLQVFLERLGGSRS